MYFVFPPLLMENRKRLNVKKFDIENPSAKARLKKLMELRHKRMPIRDTVQIQQSLGTDSLNFHIYITN